MRTSLLIAIVIATAVTPSLEAQSASQSTALQGIFSGTTARFSASGRLSEGQVIRIDGDSIWLSRGGDRFAQRLSQIDTVWIQQRRTAEGAAIGVAVGAAALGGLAGLVSNGLCETRNCKNETVTAILLGGLLGGGGGAILGAGVGALVKQWKRVMP
jgi:hypothetical protein